MSDLTPNHQKYWKSKEVNEQCQMVNEYYVNTIEGDFTNSYSVFTGFIREQKALNDIIQSIYGSPLFNKTYEKDDKPKEFTFFFIPTTKNYLDFILLLDKMISDNLNKKFFKAQNLELYELITLEEGLVERKEKGTLKLLGEWLVEIICETESLDCKSSVLSNLVEPFKSIRQERQSPAHKINENIYDRSLTEKQKEVIKKAFFTMRTLRKTFQQHPDAKNIIVSKVLDEGEIKIF